MKVSESVQGHAYYITYNYYAELILSSSHKHHALVHVFVHLQQDILASLDRTNAHPICIRLAWHDSGTYDKDTGDENWPKCGGANG